MMKDLLDYTGKTTVKKNSDGNRQSRQKLEANNDPQMPGCATLQTVRNFQDIA
jgi:hypothetical protein